MENGKWEMRETFHFEYLNWTGSKQDWGLDWVKILKGILRKQNPKNAKCIHLGHLPV